MLTETKLVFKELSDQNPILTLRKERLNLLENARNSMSIILGITREEFHSKDSATSSAEGLLLKNQASLIKLPFITTMRTNTSTLRWLILKRQSLSVTG